MPKKLSEKQQRLFFDDGYSAFEPFDLSKIHHPDSPQCILPDLPHARQSYTYLFRELQAYNKRLHKASRSKSTKNPDFLENITASLLLKQRAVLTPVFSDLLFLQSYDQIKAGELLEKWQRMVNRTADSVQSVKQPSSYGLLFTLSKLLRPGSQINGNTATPEVSSEQLKKYFGKASKSKQYGEKVDFQKGTMTFIRGDFPKLSNSLSEKAQLIDLQRTLNRSPQPTFYEQDKKKLSASNETSIKNNRTLYGKLSGVLQRKKRIYGATEDIMNKTMSFVKNPETEKTDENTKYAGSTANSKNNTPKKQLPDKYEKDSIIFRSWALKKRCEIFQQVTNQHIKGLQKDFIAEIGAGKKTMARFNAKQSKDSIRKQYYLQQFQESSSQNTNSTPIFTPKSSFLVR